MSRRAELRRTAPWALCALSLSAYVLSNVLRFRLRNEVPGPDMGWVEGTIGAVGFAGIPVVGALMVSRLPGNPYGWLWCGIGLVYGVSILADPLVDTLDGPRSATWVLDNWSFLSAVGLLVLIFLLFPTGRLPAHGWRWVARAAVILPVLLMVAVLFSSDPDDPTLAGPWPLPEGVDRILGGATIAGFLAMLLLVVAGLVSLVVRFRQAGPVQRRQLTWFLYATALIVLLLALDGVVGLVPGGLVGAVLYAVPFTLLPVALGVAVLRYGLYELDRIVSRTVSYGLLTALLIGLYLGVVALLRSLLGPLAGSSSLAVAGSTLAVAAVFDPARRRVQAAVDRRFDRARYDAARAVDAFAVRLRDQVDLDEVAGGLRDTVVDTVAPTRVAVWLRPPAPPRASPR